MKSNNFTEGPILKSLFSFALPILFTLFLQVLYGGVDLMVVGQFATTADISGVATGSQITQAITMITMAMSVGVTVVIGQKLGERQPDAAAEAVKAGVHLFFFLGLLMSAVFAVFAEQLTHLLQAPPEAVAQTCSYIRICGLGAVLITAYNLLGAVFRGLGDAKTPLYTVGTACILNILLDFLLIAHYHLGATGAAIATVISQGASVLIALLFIRRQVLPFPAPKNFWQLNLDFILQEIRIGLPVALQEILVGFSFIFIQVIVNAMGVVASAGIGIAEKLCGFIMLVPSSFMQSIAAFVAQNVGARKFARARKALLYAILTSLGVGVVIAGFTFFQGNVFALAFTQETAVVAAAHDYLKAYAIDTLLTSVMFCFVGYYDGFGYTLFVMFQGIVGSLLIRTPVAYYMSLQENCSLFQIGLSSPIATFFQIVLCVAFFIYSRRYE